MTRSDEVFADVSAIVLRVLGRDADGGVDAGTALLGAIPEFDSMAVVTVLTAVEEDFGIVIEDDDVDASVFETFGTLSDFVAAKIDA